MDGFSDTGSTPVISTITTKPLIITMGGFFLVFMRAFGGLYIARSTITSIYISAIIIRVGVARGVYVMIDRQSMSYQFTDSKRLSLPFHEYP